MKLDCFVAIAPRNDDASHLVTTGLDPVVHLNSRALWIAGSSPAMTNVPAPLSPTSQNRN
jgi:hypothetical protein